MRVRDFRHHANIDEHFLALGVLDKWAQASFYRLFGDKGSEYYQRNRERFPDHFANRPGALIELLSSEERSLLTKLRSHPEECLPWWFTENPPGHPDNKIGDVLEWSPVTIWRLSK